MLRVKGIYDGTKVVLLEPLSLPPNSPVEVVILEQQATDPEQIYWQRLIGAGLIKRVRPQPVKEQPFVPVRVIGEPISQTIIEERR
jgi:hypothetical protein